MSVLGSGGESDGVVLRGSCSFFRSFIFHSSRLSLPTGDEIVVPRDESICYWVPADFFFVSFVSFLLQIVDYFNIFLLFAFSRLEDEHQI